MSPTSLHRALNFSATPAAGSGALGDLPAWKLSDLYPSANSPEFVGDMEKAGKLAVAFEEKWKGKLADAAGKTGEAGIGAALKEYEALDDIMGRLGSFAGLTYFSNTSDPANGKLYGDVQTRLTDYASHLLFFSLELNRIDDAVMDACMANDPAAGHYRPWIVDLRKDKPHQLDDKLEQLFLEKSMTSAAAPIFLSRLGLASRRKPGHLPIDPRSNREYRRSQTAVW